MEQTAEKVVSVRTAPDELRRPLVEFLLTTADGPPTSTIIDRIYADAETRPAVWQGLLVAESTTGVVGATWAQVLPGRVASLGEPKVFAGAPAETIVALIRHAVDVAQSAGANLAQALLDPSSKAAEHAFLGAGFAHTTDLLYLVCDARLARHRTMPEAIEQFSLEPYDPHQPARLSRLIERTYVDTRDCPDLEGVRATDDVIAGYRATGQFDPSRWLIARVAADDRESSDTVVEDGCDDIACVLLADHPADDQWELIYLGVVPEWRGRGVGLALCRNAVELTRAAGRARLVLAVDAANEPALRMYARAGFEAIERRAIFLRRFDKPREM